MLSSVFPKSLESKEAGCFTKCGVSTKKPVLMKTLAFSHRLVPQAFRQLCAKEAYFLLRAANLFPNCVDGNAFLGFILG